MTVDFRKASQIGEVQLRNRVIMGSMHTGLEEEKHLTALAEFYRARAEGEVGLIITGGVSPNKAGALFAGGAMMAGDADVEKHKVVTTTVHDAKGKIFLQLLHAGRYAINPDLVAPSAIQAPINPMTPREMTVEEIEATIEDFANAAMFAKEAGYDGVEIMGSEGYLINQFLVTHTNQREDEWGGDYKNRMRFALEVARHTRAHVGADFGIIFRISLLDLIPNGSTKAEIKELAIALEASGVDALNSGFGWHEARIPTIAASVPPAPFLDLTAELKSWVSIPVIAANRFFEPAQIESAIKSGQADFVAMARPFLADADFMKKCDLPEEIAPCIACNQACLDNIFQLKHASCLVNPRACRETSMRIEPASSPKNIAVVGGGPAGVSSALVLSERGHKVTLFESSGALGGQLKLAAKIPGKSDFNRLLAYYATMMERLQVAQRMERATPELLSEFDEIVIATGVTPRIPEVEGIEAAMPYDRLLNEGSKASKVAVMGSGPIGFDVASFLVESEVETLQEWRASWGITSTAEKAGGLGSAQNERSERTVTMLQRSKTRFGKALGKTTGWIHRARLEKAGVKMIGGVTYQSVHDGQIEILTEDGAQRIESDLVAVCAGQESVRSLYDECISQGLSVHLIGGAKNAHKIDAERAIYEAYELALKV